MTGNELRRKVADIINAWDGATRGSAKHLEILNIYNNHKPLARGYRVQVGDAHCATTTSAAYIKAGIAEYTGTECGVGKYVEIAKKKGIWTENDAYTPKVGDACVYDWQDGANYATTDNTGAPDHIGIVTQVGGGIFVVTEGNMNGGKVGKRTMKVNGRYIRGFITPDFDMIARKLGGTSGGTADKPTKPTTQAAGTYTVKSGDTLSRIAAKYRHAPRFAPAGQSTQLIVGATADSDLHILRLTQGLYDRYRLKRVFYSAYVPVVEHALLPARDVKPPLLREHRLYQADWLLRFYGFRAEELLDADHPDFDPRVDPKCSWALAHPDFFPVEVNTADYETLLRVPGVGVVSARRILSARRAGRLHIDNLRRLGVVMKRAQYFLTASGKIAEGLRFTQDTLLRSLIAAERPLLPQAPMEQLSLFDSAV